MTGKRGPYIGKGEMRCAVQEKYKNKKLKEEKAKKDRLRYILRKEAKMTLSKAEKQEKKALQKE